MSSFLPAFQQCLKEGVGWLEQFSGYSLTLCVNTCLSKKKQRNMYMFEELRCALGAAKKSTQSRTGCSKRLWMMFRPCPPSRQVARLVPTCWACKWQQRARSNTHDKQRCNQGTRNDLSRTAGHPSKWGLRKSIFDSCVMSEVFSPGCVVTKCHWK